MKNRQKKKIIKHSVDKNVQIKYNSSISNTLHLFFTVSSDFGEWQKNNTRCRKDRYLQNNSRRFL